MKSTYKVDHFNARGMRVLSRVQLFVIPWTVAHQAPLSIGLSRQEYWSGLSGPPPRGSSQPRDRTQASHIADGFLTL